MTRRIWVGILLAICLSMHGVAAFAWNNTGHMTVALIAYRKLTDEQRTQLAAILKAHPHYQSFLLDGKPANVEEGEWAFLKAATWPDFVRPDKAGKKPEDITKYHHGPWHYIDIPFVVPRDKDHFDMASLRSNDSNILTALPDCVAKFSRSDTSAEDRAINLCWVEHLVGDLHQPLHCIGVYSDQYRQGDQGGNALAVRLGSTPVNFHGYWDDLLGTGESYALIDLLEMTISSAPAHDPSTMPEMKQHQTLASWANESFEDAEGIAYLGGELKTASWRAWENHQIQKEDVPELPTGYEINARELACRRVALAGYRLAKILDQALR
jgi:hypothetical protein